jgi:CHAT domain-containing protein
MNEGDMRLSWIKKLAIHCFCYLLITSMAVATGSRAHAQAAGDIQAQIVELERVIARYEASARSATPNSNAQMQVLLSMAQLATLYVKADRVQDSWPLSEKILARLEAMLGPDHPNLASQLESTASTFGLQGRYAEAEKLLKRAIAINERAFGADSLETATSLQNMAMLFRLQERYDDAFQFASRALFIADRKLPPGDIKRAMFISQVADLHMSARRYDEAEPLLKLALALVLSTQGKDTAVTTIQAIQYLQSLGLSYHHRGRHAEAQPFIDRAIAMSEQAFGPGHTMTGAMLMTLALQLFNQDQLEAAEQLYKRALPISERNGQLRASLADTYVGLGLVAFKRKDWSNAYALLRKASTITIELSQVAVAGGVSGATAATANRIARGADILLLTAVAAYRHAEANPPDAAALRDDAFHLSQHAEQSQVGGALAQMATRVSAGRGTLGTLVRERQDLPAEWQQLDRKIEAALLAPSAARNTANEDTIRRRMTEITVRLSAIDLQLARDFPDFAKLSDPAPLSITEVQAQLRPNEVLIYLSHRPNQSLVWSIGRDTVAWDLVQLGEEELTIEVQALRCGLDEAAWHTDGSQTCSKLLATPWKGSGPLPFDLERAYRLYTALLGPFAAMTKTADLIIATSGPLAALPFHVLVTEPPTAGITTRGADLASASWLGRRNAISNVPSVSSLKALRSSAKASQAVRPFFAMANPVLTGPDGSYANLAGAAKAYRTCASPTKTAAIDATNTRGRSRAVAPLQNGQVSVDVLRAQSPLPETADEVCAVARDFGVDDRHIRLADRATETEVKRLNTNGELAMYRVLHFATHGVLPGQISANSEPGLILTPPTTGTARDDGFLSASEIAELKLDADWVILSACNTAGVGRAGTESLSGLARAFFYAQARAVLASHWEVESTATVRLITSTVGALQRDPSIGRAEALRRAMVGLMDTKGALSHPQFWAPFVLVGEGGGAR